MYLRIDGETVLVQIVKSYKHREYKIWVVCSCWSKETTIKTYEVAKRQIYFSPKSIDMLLFSVIIV